jgi:hypothetical protein
MRVFVKTAAAAWTQAASTALFGCACTLIAPWHATDAVFAAREQRTAKHLIQQLNLCVSRALFGHSIDSQLLRNFEY